MAAKQSKVGTLLRIDLLDGTDAFARVLGQSQVALYALRAVHGEEINLSSVYKSKVLFKVTAMKSAFDSGRWKVVDHRPLEAELAAPTEYFLKDKMTGHYSVYRSSDGITRDSTYQECKYLEAAAVWNPEHIEDRLRDDFNGRSNEWVEQLRATP